MSDIGDIYDALVDLTDDELARQLELHRDNLNFGEQARRDLHQTMHDLCQAEMKRRATS